LGLGLLLCTRSPHLNDIHILQDRHHDEQHHRGHNGQRCKHPEQESVNDQRHQLPLANDPINVVLMLGEDLFLIDSALAPHPRHVYARQQPLRLVHICVQGRARGIAFRAWTWRLLGLLADILQLFGADACPNLGVTLTHLELRDHVFEADPGRHGLCQVVVDSPGHSGRVSSRVVKLQNKNGERNGQTGEDHDHGEVDADEGHRLARRRYVLGDQEHEHGEGEQDRDGQGHFFARVRRQPKGHDADGREKQAREEYVDDVVEGSAPQVNVEHDVREGLVRAARVQFDVALDLDGLQVPLARPDVVGHVHLGAAVRQVDLQARVGPRAVLEVADLVVEWEVCHVLQEQKTRLINKIRIIYSSF
jgi:hypothetical protein